MNLFYEPDEVLIIWVWLFQSNKNYGTKLVGFKRLASANDWFQMQVGTQISSWGRPHVSVV